MAKSKDHVGLNGTPDANPKRTTNASHVVSFRLSDDRFQQLAQMSNICEEGTPSELARELVCDVLSEGREAKQISLSVVLKRLTREVTELQERVTRLISLLGN